MDLTSSLLQRSGVKNLSENKLPKKIENILFKKILTELNTLKALTNKLPIQDRILKQNLQKLENFKPVFKNISSLDKLLNEIIKNIPNDLQQKSYIEKKITNLKTLIKKSYTLKTVQDTVISLKNEIELLIKNHSNSPQIEKFLNKFENFLKLLYKDADIKILHSSFKEAKEAFNKAKESLTLREYNKDIVSSIEKKIDIISLKIFSKNSKNEDIKQFNILLKEILLANKNSKIRLVNKQTLIQNIGNITKNIDEISSMIPNKEKFTFLKQELKNFVQNIQNINLKKNIINSGIFYEAKLADLKNSDTAFDEISKKDIKAILLKLKNEESLQNNKPIQTILDKTINQINTVQTNALISHTFLTYIPFGWQNLKDGYFSISKLKKKECFSCKIELNLHKYDKIDILMLFQKELLSIKIDIKNMEFKNLLQSHRLELKKALNDVGYNTTIFFTQQKSSKYNVQPDYKADMGMNIKI